VVGVADGDTITVLRKKEGFMGYFQTPIKIRLYGIDTPERGQAFGKKSKQFTSEMIYKKSVDVTEVTTDRYGRTVAIVFVNDQNLNEEIVRAGLAWVYTRYCDWPICDKWKNLEAEAREAKRGLWADPDRIPPWEFRRKKWRKR
jgi:endonuclease YncB( thermonuclease family)